jgi:hypothetical protein
MIRWLLQEQSIDFGGGETERSISPASRDREMGSENLAGSDGPNQVV